VKRGPKPKGTYKRCHVCQQFFWVRPCWWYRIHCSVECWRRGPAYRGLVRVNGQLGGIATHINAFTEEGLEERLEENLSNYAELMDTCKGAKP